MTCVEVSRALSAYHDGELESARRAAVAAHLADCAQCREQLRDLVRIGRLLRMGRPEVVPSGLWMRLEAAAESAKPFHRQRRRIWALRVTGMAAGFALYLGGYDALVKALTTRGRTPAATSVQLERVLRDSQVVFASDVSVTEDVQVFDRRPESRFLNAFAEDNQP